MCCLYRFAVVACFLWVFGTYVLVSVCWLFAVGVVTFLFCGIYLVWLVVVWVVLVTLVWLLVFVAWLAC